MPKTLQHRKCRYCKEWFTLNKIANPRGRFCSRSCAASFRSASPAWKRTHSKRVKAWAVAHPEIIRAAALKAWSPENRERTIAGLRRNANSKEHLLRFARHNKKLWSDPVFRAEHSKRTRERATKQWRDPDFRKKISELTIENNKKRWSDPEYKARVSVSISAALKGRKRRPQAKDVIEANKERLVRMNKERWSDPEWRAKMIDHFRRMMRLKWKNPVYRVRHKARLARTVRSKEFRLLMSECTKKRWTPEYTAKVKAWWTSERRLAMAEESAKRWADPKYKAKLSKRLSKVRGSPESRALQSEISKKWWAKFKGANERV